MHERAQWTEPYPRRTDDLHLYRRVRQILGEEAWGEARPGSGRGAGPHGPEGPGDALDALGDLVGRDARE